MTATTLELPFVRGVQTAGDKRAATEFAELKLETAHNVHVRPEHADVLYRRPGMASTGAARTSRCTVGQIGDTLTLMQDQQTLLPDPAGGAVVLGSTYQVTELSSMPVEGLAGAPGETGRAIMAMGYTEADGDNACIVRTTTLGGSHRLQTQRKRAGVWQESVSHLISASSNVYWRRTFIFCTGTQYVVFVGGRGGVPSVDVMTTSSLTGSFGAPATLLANAILWDVVPYSSGWLLLYHETGSNSLRLVQVTSVFGLGTATTIFTGLGVAAVAGVVWIGGTTAHVWHGGWPSDSDTLYLNQVTVGGASAGVANFPNALGVGNTLSAMAVGGGSAVAASAGGTEAASYCYVTAGAGPTAKLGRMWRATSGAVQTNNNYCGAIYPRTRLWTSGAFFGARLYGVQANVYGVWHFTASAGDERVSYPVVLHSTTLGEASPIVYDLHPRACSMHVSTDGTEAKGIFWGENGAHVALAHVGFHASTGQCLSQSGITWWLSGAPRYYDGVALTLAGIAQRPAFALTPSGGGTLAAGVYAYAVVWEYYDRQGRRQQSPARVQTVTVGALGQVTLVIDPFTQPTDERNNGDARLRARIYRTEPGGNVLRTASNSTINVSSSLRYSSATYFNFTDSGGLYDFSAGETLYSTTSGAGELDSFAIESCTSLRGYSDRIVTVGTLFPGVVTYSKTLRQGRVVESNPNLILILPDAITALAYQDGNLYCFSATNVWALTPSFADDTGNGAGGVDPVPLATGIGCSQVLSIVETPVGVMFVGPRGVYMIARGGGPPQFIGADVEPMFLAYPTVYGAAHNARTHEVCWVLSNGSDHRVLVYNYQLGQWFTWRIGAAVHTSLTTLDGGVAVVAGNFVFCQRGVTAGGQALLALSDALTTDTHDVGGTAQIALEVQSRDIALPGTLGGMSRVLTMSLDANGPASALSVSESHDSGATWSTERSISTVGTSPAMYQFVRQKTSGVRFRLRNPSGVGPVVMSGIALRVSGQGRPFTANTYRRG
jgi:hypothetical protein